MTTEAMTTTMAPINLTTEPNIPFFTFLPAMPVYHAKNLTATSSSHPPEACEHIITTYVIPNVLHFGAFIMGMYHFRFQENEQLYALMEKVSDRR